MQGGHVKNSKKSTLCQSVGLNFRSPLRTGSWVTRPLYREGVELEVDHREKLINKK